MCSMSGGVISLTKPNYTEPLDFISRPAHINFKFISESETVRDSSSESCQSQNGFQTFISSLRTENVT